MVKFRISIENCSIVDYYYYFYLFIFFGFSVGKHGNITFTPRDVRSVTDVVHDEIKENTSR